MSTSEDIRFMRLAIRLALKGKGKVSPNPMVGAVLVKNHRLIAKGFHARFGGPHAEIVAIQRAKTKTQDATLYLTLEPCSTYGKTPPCIETVLKSGIKRIVIGTLDPNPAHHGKSISLLKRSGIELQAGILEKETEELIAPFKKWITKKIPYCVVKSAMSLDGKISTSFGESKWITGSSARKYGHRLRSEIDAVMIGINTVLKDNPELTSHGRGNDPFKVIVDTHAKIPLNSKVLKNSSKTIIAVSDRISSLKEKALQRLGARVIKIPSKSQVDLTKLFFKLGKLGINTILVEGGGQLIASVLEKKLADRILFFYAPILIGGTTAPTSFEGKGILKLKNAISIVNMKISKIDEDFLVEGDVKYKSRF